MKDGQYRIVQILTAIIGTIVLINALGVTPLRNVSLALIGWTSVLIALALLVGLVSVTLHHVQRLRRRDPDWIYSIVLLVSMITVVVIGIFGGGNPLEQQVLVEPPVRFLFRLLYEPLASSLLALLTFFSLSAALRAMSERRIEAWVIVGVAIVVLVSQIAPVATLPFVGTSMQWFNDIVVLAGARGLLIGVAIGTIVASIRVLFGFDLPYLDR